MTVGDLLAVIADPTVDPNAKIDCFNGKILFKSPTDGSVIIDITSGVVHKTVVHKKRSFDACDTFHLENKEDE